MKLTCNKCKREYAAARWDPPYICRECAWAEMVEETMAKVTGVCKCCGKPFHPERVGQHVCEPCEEMAWKEYEQAKEKA